MLQDYRDASVLIIDDMPANLILLQRLLTRRGLRTVHVAADPRAAVAQLPQTDPDLVLLDIHMPDLDGHAVLAELRRWAAGSYLPVIVLTADTTAETLEQALAMGATDFLTKPFNATEIVLRVRNLLQTREMFTALRRHVHEADARLAAVLGHVPHERGSDEERRRRVQAVLAAGGPDVVFQPVIDLTDSSVAGYEALSRFGPETATPDAWFEDADSVGLGIDLELAAVRAGLRGAASFPASTFLAVNVSPACLVSGRLPEAVYAANDATSAAQRDAAVVFELTEHVPVADYTALVAAFEPLRAEGALLAVDDTGAGYAGLRHLLHLNPDVIKLDISMVHSIDTDPVRRALAAALLTFSYDIGARVIAEGVETAAQARVLTDLGVTWVQGWLYGRPAPAAEQAG